MLQLTRTEYIHSTQYIHSAVCTLQLLRLQSQRPARYSLHCTVYTFIHTFTHIHFSNNNVTWGKGVTPSSWKPAYSGKSPPAKRCIIYVVVVVHGGRHGTWDWVSYIRIHTTVNTTYPLIGCNELIWTMNQFVTCIQDFIHPQTTDEISKPFITVTHKPDVLESRRVFNWKLSWHEFIFCFE